MPNSLPTEYRFCFVVVTVFFLLASMGMHVHARELLINPGFETLNSNGVPAPWFARGGGGAEKYPFETGGVKITNEFVKSGGVAVQLELDSGDYYIAQALRVDPGKEYELSAWVKSSLSSGGKTALKAEFRDPNDQYITAAQWSKEWNESFEDWEKVSMRIVAPENAARAFLLLRLYGPGVAYYDEVSFKEIRDLEAIGSCEGTACNPEAVRQVLDGKLDEANVMWWGFDPEDSTAFIQAAIDSGAPRVIIPNVGRDWIVRPITLRSNLELILEEGVVVTAKKGEYLGRMDSVFSALDAENLVIKGYGATIRMHKEDYTRPPYERAEWRHTIDIRGGKNVEVAGVTVRDSGGDGIYLGRGTVRKNNEDIVIRDVIADNNYRQGISIINGKNLLIENSVFKNTGGTDPMAGIDIEPNFTDEKLENIVVRNSVFDMNDAFGITLNITKMDSSLDVSILMENILVRGSRYGLLISTFGSEGQQPSGEFVVRNCIIEGSERNGIMLRNRYRDESSQPLEIRFENCIIHDVVRNAALFQTNIVRSVPIALFANSWLEAVHFEDVVVVDNVERPVLYGQVQERDGETAVGFRGITGRIDVVNPYGASVLWDEDALDRATDITLEAVERTSVTIAYDEFINLPEYQFPPIEVQVGPTVRVSNLKPAIYTTTAVQGVFTPDIELLHFDAVDVRYVEILLNDDLIYSGAKLPEAGTLEIDTRRLFDDYRHRIDIIIHGKDGENIRTSAYFQTQNFTSLMDPIEGPKELAWFGSVYNPVVIEQSDGWQYATDNPANYLGDATRKHRVSNTTEYLLWQTPSLWDFEFELYAQTPSVEDVIVVEVSKDRQTWRTVTYNVEEAGTSPAGWSKLVVGGAVPEDGDHTAVDYVRLTLKQSETDRDIHVGRALFRMVRP